jgi:hypothetical protein
MEGFKLVFEPNGPILEFLFFESEISFFCGQASINLPKKFLVTQYFLPVTLRSIVVTILKRFMFSSCEQLAANRLEKGLSCFKVVFIEIIDSLINIRSNRTIDRFRPRIVLD